LPTKAYGDDAGFDLYVSEATIIPAGQFCDVPSGVAAQIPARCWGLITGRSSTLRKRGLLVYQGVIDPGYRGELFTGIQNVGAASQAVEVGERLAQLLLFHNASLDVQTPTWVTELDPHERGSNGFGSSGS
jgi:dUTP pyrophosphatase